MNETLSELVKALMEQTQPSIPTFGQLVFLPFALLAALSALMVGITKNLFHSSLSLVATLFAVAALYITLEAEFLAVSQVLVYIGAISTLITFAIMLTRGMMFGNTSPVNRQMLASSVIVVLLFFTLSGVVMQTQWATQESYDSAIAAAQAAATSTEGVAASETVTDTVVASETVTDIVTATEAISDTASLAASGETTATSEIATTTEVTTTAEISATEVATTEVAAAAPITETEGVTATTQSAPAEPAVAEAAPAGPSIEEIIAKFSERPLPLLPASNALIAQLGTLFVTTYLIPFELMALLLLVSLAGAILLARDRKRK